MTPDQFIAELALAGFLETVEVTREADGVMQLHSHPFEAKALILAGELQIWVDEAERRYQAGEVFHLSANQRHSERYGPQGVTYLVGRK